MPRINEVLKSEEYDDLIGSSEFTKNDIDWLNKRIQTRSDGSLGVTCIIRGKTKEGDFFKLNPEEAMRQLYAHKLITKYGYKKEQIYLEYPVTYSLGSSKVTKAVDIVIFKSVSENNSSDVPYICVEAKRPEVKDENKKYGEEKSTPLEQMQSYCRQVRPILGVIVNGCNLHKFYEEPFDNALSADDFPKENEDIERWKEQSGFTIKHLMLKNRLENESLKKIIEVVEQKFNGNDSSDRDFEEIFKLIFMKLYDEYLSTQDFNDIESDMRRHNIKLADVDDAGFRPMEFYVRDADDPDQTKKRMSTFFKKAKDHWEGVFGKKEELELSSAALTACMRELQEVKLSGTDLEIVDEAFEYLVNKNLKKDMSQYFTPRYVIDMCVRMLDPKPDETMIDTACGSCGFPMHTTFHVWNKMNPGGIKLFGGKRTTEELDYVKAKVFGIDYSEKSVMVARMLNIIAGDGHTNVIRLNTLDYRNWDKNKRDSKWDSRYGSGYSSLIGMADTDENGSKDYKNFHFDIVMANPPFSGTMEDRSVLSCYEFGKDKHGNAKKSADKLKLFIERDIDFLKPGGRMAIVLPRGILNNINDQVIRDYIMDKCRVLAVVDLHENAFKPHTGTKTSVLFVQKWTDNKGICPRKDDYPIFFAVMQEPSKDNSGDKIYVKDDFVEIRKKDGFEEKLPRELFLKKYGNPDENKRWTLSNKVFRIKKNAKREDLPGEVNADEYLKLSEADRVLYVDAKKTNNLSFPEIGKAEYDALSKVDKKLYVPSVSVIETTEFIKDTSGNKFVKHDLYNHDPNLDEKYSRDGIAEAFLKFAKDEGLSFVS